MKDVIINVLPIVITAIGTFIVGIIKKKYNEYVNTDTKKEIAMLTVRYVEQVFTALHGKDKLEKAKSTFVDMLNEKGIEVSEAEINMLLEAAVHQMNERKGADK